MSRRPVRAERLGFAFDLDVVAAEEHGDFRPGWRCARLAARVAPRPSGEGSPGEPTQAASGGPHGRPEPPACGPAGWV
jgi:hypothetical protein